MRMVDIPVELSNFFSRQNFENYPKLSIPQSFIDDRGSIFNIADGVLGDVATIVSLRNSVRANHVHNTDWHISYCLKGSLIYSFLDNMEVQHSLIIRQGEMFFTPVGIPHRMDFIEECTLIVVSRNSRKSEKYDEDTKRFILSDPRKH